MSQRNMLTEKMMESIRSILPITAIVAIVCFAIVPVPSGLMLAFLLGALMMIVGMGLFSLGADLSMSKIGGHIGSKMTTTRKLWLILVLSFILGTAITLAEPDLQVLATNVPAIDKNVLLIAVSVGVGFFLMVSMLRILFAVSLRTMLIVFYVAVFSLALIVNREMLSVAFDSGGVTTGPMTVPFIMSLGVGVSAIRSDENAKSDSFGLVALCSIGPVLAVMLLGLIFEVRDGAGSTGVIPDFGMTVDIGAGYVREIPDYLREVAMALLPIFCFFLVFQVVSLHLRRKPFRQILIGILYTYTGLVLFLTGVNVGFSPLGEVMGETMASLPVKWMIIPLAILMGWFIIQAEPAVHVLTKQVEELTAGAVSERAIGLSLSLAVASANGLAMLRVLTGIPIMYFLIPGYMAALLLSFYVPGTFTGIAFDSGGVASGPLTATFMLSFAIGACSAVGGNIMTDAFGLVALVAMMPLITVQGLGAIYVLKSGKVSEETPVLDDEIIELW